MADAIIIAILVICALLALRACLRKKCGKEDSCCGGGCGNCGGCSSHDSEEKDADK